MFSAHPPVQKIDAPDQKIDAPEQKIGASDTTIDVFEIYQKQFSSIPNHRMNLKKKRP